MTKENNIAQWALRGGLLLAGLFVIIALVLIKSQAETTTVNLLNVPTVIDLVKLCSNGAATNCTAVTTFTGQNSAPTDMDFFVKVSDANGYGDIASVAASIRRTGFALAGCDTGVADTEEDGNYCYNNWDGQNNGGIDACTQVSTEGDTVGWWKCDVTFQYWMDATDGSSNFSAESWVTSAIAVDGTGDVIDTTATDTATFEVATVLSMNFGSSTIDYGTLSLGQTATGLAVLGTVQGNSDVDMTIQAGGAVMSCNGTGSADMAVSVQKFGTDNALYASLASNLSTTAQHLDFETFAANDELKARANEVTAETDSVYFGIQIPSTGVSGTCTVAATLVAVNS